MTNVATNAVPNLTVFGQLFDDILLNEVHCAIFGPLCSVVKFSRSLRLRNRLISSPKSHHWRSCHTQSLDWKSYHEEDSKSAGNLLWPLLYCVLTRWLEMLADALVKGALLDRQDLVKRVKWVSRVRWLMRKVKACFDSDLKHFANDKNHIDWLI